MSKTSKPSKSPNPTPEEKEVIEQMRRHPELLKRIQGILNLADESGCTADELEDLLIPEVRALGLAAMDSWSKQGEKEIGDQFKQSHPGAQQSKKKR